MYTTTLSPLRGDSPVIPYYNNRETDANTRVQTAYKLNMKALKVYSYYLLISLIIFFISLIFQAVCSIFSDQYYSTGEVALKDRIHDLVGGTPPKWAEPETVNLLCSTFTVISILRFVIFEDFLFSFAIFTRIFLNLTIMYTLRGVAIIITTVPNPLPSCVPVQVNGIRDLSYGIYEMLLGDRINCTDLIISGHTLFATSHLLAWIYYSHKNKITLFFIFLWTLLIYISIDVSFLHYTVDVFLGTFLTLIVWVMYHQLIDIAAQNFRLKYKQNYTEETIQDKLSNNQCLIVISKILGTLEGLEYRLENQYRQIEYSQISQSDSLSFPNESESTNCESEDYKDDIADMDPTVSLTISPKKYGNDIKQFLEAYQGKGYMHIDNLRFLMAFVTNLFKGK